MTTMATKMTRRVRIVIDRLGSRSIARRLWRIPYTAYGPPVCDIETSGSADECRHLILP